MKRVLVLIILAIFPITQASADWDPELEAQEQAQQAAAQRAAQEKQFEIQKMRNEAQAKANTAIMAEKRKSLGAAAAGKSDAEVNSMLDAKIKSDTEAAYKGAQEARNALNQGQGAAAVKSVTGKSMQELENMSDEEAEALGREMERKYGQ